jgi:hypothetical protein
MKETWQSQYFDGQGRLETKSGCCPFDIPVSWWPSYNTCGHIKVLGPECVDFPRKQHFLKVLSLQEHLRTMQQIANDGVLKTKDGKSLPQFEY